MASFGYGGAPARWDSQSWSFTLGWVFGIRVRLHGVWIFLAVVYLLVGFKEEKLEWYAVLGGLLFGSVLLHEFGHCFGCRAVGGQADDVLIWPLGGLAFTAPPHRPYEHLITTLAGPFVNLSLCLMTMPALIYLGAADTSLFNPLGAINISAGRLEWYLALLFKVNYILFLFNVVLPIYPFDGGRVLQEILWFRLGYYQASMIAAHIGMGAAILLGLISLYFQDLLLFCIFVFGFFESLRLKKELELMGQFPENEFGYDFSQGYTSLEQSMPKTRKGGPRPSLRAQFGSWLERRRKKQESELKEEVDRILDKIHHHGLESLTRTERSTLHRASKRMQQK